MANQKNTKLALTDEKINWQRKLEGSRYISGPEVLQDYDRNGFLYWGWASTGERKPTWLLSRKLTWNLRVSPLIKNQSYHYSLLSADSSNQDLHKL